MNQYSLISSDTVVDRNLEDRPRGLQSLCDWEICLWDLVSMYIFMDLGVESGVMS